MPDSLIENPKSGIQKLKLLTIFLIFLAFVFCFFMRGSSWALTLPPGSLDTVVSGSIGEYYISITGYISPFASVVLYSQGVYLRATTADENGYFRISDVLVKYGLTELCFDAYDFKRLGESYSCIEIPPVTKSTTIENIFLPPTLGLSKTQIGEGGSTTAWGYSMPGATVTLNFQGKLITTTADPTGYYQFNLDNIKAGIYELTAKGSLDNKSSLDPKKKAILKSLSGTQQAVNWLDELLKKLWIILTTYWFIAISIPILILIIILIWKLFPGKFSRHHYLHHQYLFGY